MSIAATGGDMTELLDLRPDTNINEAEYKRLLGFPADYVLDGRVREPDKDFFLEVVGAAVVEHLITTAGARLCAWAEQKGMAVLPHYSPGYSGWDVADQSALFALISQTRDYMFPHAVSVLESG